MDKMIAWEATDQQAVARNRYTQETTVYACVYADCGKTFQTVNCVHCNKVNMWKDADYQD